MAKLLESYKFAFSQLPATFLDGGDLVSRRLRFRQLANALVDAPGFSRANVMPQSLTH
ncbi:MAG TPA: hypothetical protein VF913_08385 [Xanthobacteraceae bacterium]